MTSAAVEATPPPSAASPRPYVQLIIVNPITNGSLNARATACDPEYFAMAINSFVLKQFQKLRVSDGQSNRLLTCHRESWRPVILYIAPINFQIQTLLTPRNCFILQLHVAKVVILVQTTSFNITFRLQNSRQSGYNWNWFT